MIDINEIASTSRKLLRLILPESIVSPLGECLNYLTGRRELWGKFCTCYNISRFKKEFKRQANKKKPISADDSLFWNMYLQVLLEAGDAATAKTVFSSFKKALPSIPMTSCFLKIANFVDENDLCCDASVKRSAKLFKQITTCHNGSPFFKLVDGKTVAVVGNAPCELGTGNGNAIDDHDIVIRFNNFCINPEYAMDYGQKTTVRAKAQTADVRHDYLNYGIEMNLYADDLTRMPIIHPGTIESLEYDIEHQIAVDYIDIRSKSAFSERENLWPTTGLLVLDQLKRSNAKSVDAFGFSFLNGSTPPAVYQHYQKDITQDRLSAETHSLHRIDREFHILKSMFQGRRLIMDRDDPRSSR